MLCDSRQGISLAEPDAKKPPVKRQLARPLSTKRSVEDLRQTVARPVTPPSNAEILARRPPNSASDTLLLCDFDNTLTDFDAGGLAHGILRFTRLLVSQPIDHSGVRS